MTKRKEICAVYLDTSMFVDDCIFYSDGRVNTSMTEISGQLTMKNGLIQAKISDPIRKKLFEKCPREFKEREIFSIFDTRLCAVLY